MFTQKELSLLTSPYFKTIRKTEDFYEIQSQCTGHCWIIQKPYVYKKHPIRIYHKHTKVRHITTGTASHTPYNPPDQKP